MTCRMSKEGIVLMNPRFVLLEGRRWSRRREKAAICSELRAARFQGGFLASRRACLLTSASRSDSHLEQRLLRCQGSDRAASWSSREIQAPQTSSQEARQRAPGEATAAPVNAGSPVFLTKLKRIRRVEQPKPQSSPVSEAETEQVQQAHPR